MVAIRKAARLTAAIPEGMPLTEGTNMASMRALAEQHTTRAVCFFAPALYTTLLGAEGHVNVRSHIIGPCQG